MIEQVERCLRQHDCDMATFHHIFDKLLFAVPESLTQLVGTIAFYMQEPGFDPRTLHLFTLWVDFQVTRLPHQKNTTTK
jgi:hypothetical protein